MLVSDMYGLPVSNSRDAMGIYQQGVNLADGFDASGIDEFKQAIEQAPDFALAHAFLARMQNYYGLGQESESSMNAAIALIDKVSDREASLIQVLSATLNFQATALESALGHIKQWPLDRFVLSLIVGPFGLYAFSGQHDWRERSLALLEGYQATWPEDDWWYLSILAFSKGECGALSEAEELGDRAWSLSDNANCTHTLAHIHKEQSDPEKGSHFLKNCLSRTQRTSDMRHHLVWHLALLDLESGRANSASMEELYRQEFDPEISAAMPLDNYADNASILWRCLLHDIEMDKGFARQTLDYGKQHFPDVGFSFADMHRVLLTALIGESGEIDELRTILAAKDSDGFLSGILKAAVAFTQNDFKQAQDQFHCLLADTMLLGGSNPQRGVILESYNAVKLKR